MDHLTNCKKALSPGRKNVKSDSIKGQTIRPGDVHWVRNLKFDDGTHGKDRPIVILGLSDNVVSYYKCTTQEASDDKRYYILDLVEAGLDRDTFVVLERLTLGSDRIGRKIGRLSDLDRLNIGLR